MSMTDIRNLRPHSARSNSLQWPTEALRPQTSPAGTFGLQGGGGEQENDPDWPLGENSVRLPKTLCLQNRPRTGSKPDLLKTIHRNSLPAASSPAPHPLMIEGLQTGQVVEVEPTLKRVASEDRVSTARQRDTARRNSDTLERDRKERLKQMQLISKLEKEVKRLKELLHLRDGEIATLKGKAEEELIKHVKALAVKDEEIATLKAKIERKGGEADASSNRARELRDDLEVMHSKLDAERTRSRARELELEEKNRTLQQKVNSLTQQLQTAEAKGAQLGDARRDAERQRDELVTRLKQEVEHERLKAQGLEREMRSQREGQTKAEAEVLSFKDKIKQYNAYIQKICQPQFSVVKDDSLTPVNPSGFNVVEGHVLVPLVLLLEGYAFLPQEMRETYNQTEYNPPTAGRRKSLTR